MKSLLKTIAISAFCLMAILLITGMGLTSCGGDQHQHITIETEYGNMKAVLYNETPQHRDNFVKLVKENYYDDLLFHRVIQGFMIQGGDPDSRNATPDAQLGSGGPGYQVPAEIGKVHVKGALAAARNNNPQKASSGSQFYIVQGLPVTDDMLDSFAAQKGIVYTEEQRNLYKELGGTPQLDNEYTVFGEVIEGLDVIDKMAAVQKGPADRPVQDVKMKIKMAD